MYQCNYEYLNNNTTKVICLRRKLNQVCVHSAKFRTEPDWREKAVLLFCQMPKLIYVENVEPEMTRKTAWPFSALKIISKSRCARKPCTLPCTMLRCVINAQGFENPCKIVAFTMKLKFLSSQTEQLSLLFLLKTSVN